MSFLLLESGDHLLLEDTGAITYGGDGRFTTTSPTVPSPDATSLLPLELSVEITTANGRVYRWDTDSANSINRPLAVTFSTQQGDGFADASCAVSRPIDLDYSDLNLLDRVRFIGADGEIAYEGRISALPRTVDSDGERIQISCNGLMASAKDRTFTEIYVDRLGDRWKSPSLALRKATLLADTPLDAHYTTTVDAGSITFKGTSQPAPGTNIPAGSQTQVEYVAPTGVKMSGVQYSVTEQHVTNEDAGRLYGTDDDSQAMGLWSNVAMATTAGLHVVGLDTATSHLGMRMQATADHLATVPAARHFGPIAVYSDHGVPLRDNGGDPAGVYASDVISDLIGRFCPLLNADGVEATQTVIAHLVFDTPTTPFDAFTLLNGYHLFNLGVWENGTVVFSPADLTNADWQVRREDQGVTLDLQGDAIDSFANGIVVTYPGVEGENRTLYPTFFDDLRDDDPDNPANKQGIQLWTSLDLSNPADQKGALALGQAALREFNRPKAPGTVNIALGYIEDRQGNLQPGHKVRAGDTLQITDLPNDSPRLITATSWSEDGSLQLTLEQPSTRVDAVLARLDLASQL